MSATSWKSGINGDWSNAADWSAGTIPNTSYAVTIAASGAYAITVSVAEAAGSLNLTASGATLLLDSPLNIAGTLTATQGAISIASGQTLSLAKAVTFGLLNSGGPLIGGPGTLLTTGPVSLVAQTNGAEGDLYLGVGATWNNSGTVADAGLIVFGFPDNDTDAIINQAGAVFDFTTDNANISLDGGFSGQAAAFTNAGLLEKTGGTATSTIEASITNTTAGTIDATSGTLSLAAGGMLAGELATSGAGVLAFTGGSFTLANAAVAASLLINGGSLTINTPVALSGGLTETGPIGSLNINVSSSESGTLTATGAEILIASGQTLSLANAVTFGLLNSGGPLIGGPGTLLTTGPVSLVAQINGAEGDLYLGAGATWSNSGTVTEAGLIVFGFPDNDTDAIINQTGAVFDLTTDNANISPDGSFSGQTAAFTNAGLLEKTGGTATSTIEASITNTATGTIAATSGTLSITGSLEGTGKLEIGANSALAFTGAVSELVAFNGTYATLVLEQPTLYTGSLSGIQNGDTIYLVGVTASQPTVSGDTLTIQRSGGAALVYSLIGTSTDETVTAVAVSGGTDIVFGTGAPTSPTGVAWGDVHFIDYDGLTYNFQAEGEFVIARATAAGDNFQVQARLQPYYNGASVTVMTQVAAAVGADRVTFGIGRAATVWIDGAPSGLSAANPVITLAGGNLTELSGSTYQINWNNGESLTVSDIGGYFNVTVQGAPGTGAGALVGLLGSDSGPANDFQLADGTVIPQPLTTQELYGEYADAWRVTDATSLLDYGAGQDTATFTDVNFPSDVASLASLPAAVVQNAESLVQSAGITNAGIAQGAIEDYALTGDPSFIDSAGNLQNVVATSTIVADPASAGTVAGVGIAATAGTVIESATGNTAVTFDIYRIGAATQAQVVDYSVLAPGTPDLGVANFAGGVLPSGAVTIAAGATSTILTIDVTGNIGTLPEQTLFTQIDTGDSGVAVVAPTASAIIANDQPVEGSPAVAAFVDPDDIGTLSQSGDTTTLNLGQLLENTSQAAIEIDLVNQGSAGGDLLSGAFSIVASSGIQISGLGQVTDLAAGGLIPLTVSIDTATVGALVETIHFAPVDSNSSGFQSTLSGLSLMVEAEVVACFRQGTDIATAAGETRVEALREGDLVRTATGALRPIAWIGRRKLDCCQHTDPRKVWPVRVRAGAFAPRAPQRDLWLSPDHAIFVDGVLIPVRYLINGTSVAQLPQDHVVYWHIELATHDILLAEGLTVESLLTCQDRAAFDNGGTPAQMHPEFHSLAWDAHGCAPLVVTGSRLRAVCERLQQRSRMALAVGLQQTVRTPTASRKAARVMVSEGWY